MTMAVRNRFNYKDAKDSFNVNGRLHFINKHVPPSGSATMIITDSVIEKLN